MITVKMMIDLLIKYPEDLRVVVSGYEEGWDDLSPEQICVIPVVPDTGKNDWQGQHLDADDVPEAFKNPCNLLKYWLFVEPRTDRNQLIGK